MKVRNERKCRVLNVSAYGISTFSEGVNIIVCILHGLRLTRIPWNQGYGYGISSVLKKKKKL